MYANLAVRFFVMLFVVCCIGLARKSCVREWRLARTDALTGALNRQAFFEVVESDKCTGGWSAIVFADLDGLKRMNDEHGHDRGDTSLRLFSERIRKTIRKDDIFARMGGDEFVIFMKIKDQDSGFAVAQRLHRAINLDAGERSEALKCSFGILLLPDGSTSIDAELKAVDDLMYRAKASGAGVCLSTGIEAGNALVLSPAISFVDAMVQDNLALPNAPAQSGTRAAA